VSEPIGRARVENSLTLPVESIDVVEPQIGVGTLPGSGEWEGISCRSLFSELAPRGLVESSFQSSWCDMRWKRWIEDVCDGVVELRGEGGVRVAGYGILNDGGTKLSRSI
jgi:hypothetical protein